MRAPRVLKLVAVALLVLLTGGPPSHAQNEGGLHLPFLEFFRPAPPRPAVQAPPPTVQQPFRPRPRPQRLARPPVREREAVREREVVREREAAPRPRRAAPAPAPVVVRDAPERPAVEASAVVAVLGDQFGELLAAGLADAFGDDVAVQRKARNASGLVREDYYDWRRAVRDLLAGRERVTHAVMMVGANDRQPIAGADGATLEPLTEGWREAYGTRVEEIARAFADRNVPLVWVGMPPMRNERYSADMMALNELVRARVVKAGGRFVDIWEAFVDAENRYAAVGPDLSGQPARLRTTDGVHLTRAGARKAAHFVEIELKRLIDRKAAPAIVVAAPTDEAPRPFDSGSRPGGVEALIDEMVRRGLPDGPVLPTIATKPASGPIIPLTTPEATPGGVLLTGPWRWGASEAARLAERVLVDGRAPDPKPGRGDDFRWPPAPGRP